MDGKSTRYNALNGTLSLDKALQETGILKSKYDMGKAKEAMEELLYGALGSALYGALSSALYGALVSALYAQVYVGLLTNCRPKPFKEIAALMTPVHSSPLPPAFRDLFTPGL